MNHRRLALTLIATLLVLGLAVSASAAPKEATISGTVIDLSCASKAKANMDSWANTKNDHMMPGGKTAASCAAMCLKNGQPAALFDGKKISAVFACAGEHTLSGFAGKDVEVKGYWGPNMTFVPAQIKASGASWQEVQCSAMHG